MTTDELKTTRQRLGLSQAGLAGYLKVAPNTVARWERGVLALPPFLDLALETVEVQVREERRQRGPGRPSKRRRSSPRAPQCQDCGMRHDPNDKASCIEGHGDDPAPRAPRPGEGAE